VRAEQNLYGRLTLEEFFILAREVALYTQGNCGLFSSFPCIAVSSSLVIGRASGAYYVGQVQPGRMPAAGGNNPRGQVHRAAVRLALPVGQRDERISYLDQYSCRPPPLFLLLISLAQIGVFVWHVILLGNRGKKVGPNGPPYVEGQLIFNPDRKFEVWRYASYCLVHSGYFHIVFNILVQLMLGMPLEMVHRWWRILLVSGCSQK